VSLSPEDIHRVCELARLAVGDSAMPAVYSKLSSVIALVDELQAVDTRGIEPLAHPLDRPQRLRDDVVTERDDHERYQANAPSVEKGLYLVPKVIE
jgi:aspartyl-tRNA(Asn)/glutamyl-tRNA(Gln) amidotransferase subunit C